MCTQARGKRYYQPVRLIVCASNEGAEEVARELQDAAKTTQPELEFDMLPRWLSPRGVPRYVPRYA